MNFGYENSVNKTHQIEALWVVWNAPFYFSFLQMRKKIGLLQISAILNTE